MLLKSISLYRFKCMREYRANFSNFNVLAGPNNAGKSTILDALRALSGALRYARRINPRFLRSEGLKEIWGYELPDGSLPINLTNVHYNYLDTPATLSFRFDNNAGLRLVFETGQAPRLEIDGRNGAIETAVAFRHLFPIDVGIVPTLGPFEEEESLLSNEYVNRWEKTRRSHRMFRNIWHRRQEEFEEFARYLEENWPEISVDPVESMSDPGQQTKLIMFFKERRIPKEVYWSGFGLQIWMQIITHLIISKESNIFVLDEPDIYLHPDIQLKLLKALRATNKQIFIATHSVEIINACDYHEIVSIDKARTSARCLDDLEGIQGLIAGLGSAQNIYLDRLSRGKKMIFVEGDDLPLIKRLATICKIGNLASAVDLVPVAVGGFSQRDRVRHARWIFSELLRADVRIAAIVDRDYRCEEEICEIESDIRRDVSCFHIWRSKEIENYFLNQKALLGAVSERAASRAQTGQHTNLEACVEKILWLATDQLRDDTLSQIAGNMSRYLRGRGGVDESTVIGRAIKEFETGWKTLDYRFQVISGKDFLRIANDMLQKDLKVSISIALISRHLRRDDLRDEVSNVLLSVERELYK